MTHERSVLDVAARLLEAHGPMDAMKLQKLCYYSEAWHLAFEGKSMFDDAIEAWANGPVIPNLFAKHRGRYVVDSVGGDPTRLAENEIETIDVVFSTYGHLNGAQLSQLTHDEAPWREARGNAPEGARSNNELDRVVMQDFYAARVA